jgi:hypothetical protein
MNKSKRELKQSKVDQENIVGQLLFNSAYEALREGQKINNQRQVLQVNGNLCNY